MLDYFLYPIIRLLYWHAGNRRERILGCIFSVERLFQHQIIREEIKNLSNKDKKRIIISVVSGVIGGIIVFIVTSIIKFFMSLF